MGVLSLNIPKKESETDYYTTSGIANPFSRSRKYYNFRWFMIFSSIKEYIDETKNGFPLWKYFLVLALLSLLAEVFNSSACSK